MTAYRARTAALITAAALVVTPLLASCGQVAEKAAEQAAEQAIGGDVDINGDGVTVTDDEGNEMAIGENVAIPDNWPAEVPLYEGGTLTVVSVNKDGSANAMWTAEGTPKEAADAYGAVLESADYTVDSDSAMGEMVVREYTGKAFTVGVNAIEADGTTTLMVSAIPVE